MIRIDISNQSDRNKSIISGVQADKIPVISVALRAV